MMPSENFGARPEPIRCVTSLAPFPRSVWIHPDVPTDNYDRVCKIIWGRVKEIEKDLDRSQRAEEHWKEADDLGLSTQCKDDEKPYHTDLILPCPYLSGCSHPHLAKPARALSPVIEAEMKQKEEDERGKRNLPIDEDDKKKNLENPIMEILGALSSSRRDKQSSVPEAPSLVCSAAGNNKPYLQVKEDPRLTFHSRVETTCQSEDELSVRSSPGTSSGDDDDFVALPKVRTRATDSSDDDSASGSSDCEAKNENPHSDQMSSDSKQDSSSCSSEDDFPPLSPNKTGVLPNPTEPQASGKMQGQWEIPLSFHPHDIPTATLANSGTDHAKARVQVRAKSPRANLKIAAPPAAPMQQEAYDLLADFPALQPPKKPLALGIFREKNQMAKNAEGNKGCAHSPNHCQKSGAPQQRRMGYVPHEVSSICARDQKSGLDGQGSGSPNKHGSQTKANHQPPPAGVNNLELLRWLLQEKYFLSRMTQLENVFVMRGLLCSGKVNYTVILPYWLLVQSRGVDTDINYKSRRTHVRYAYFSRLIQSLLQTLQKAAIENQSKQSWMRGSLNDRGCRGHVQPFGAEKVQQCYHYTTGVLVVVSEERNFLGEQSGGVRAALCRRLLKSLQGKYPLRIKPASCIKALDPINLLTLLTNTPVSTGLRCIEPTILQDSEAPVFLSNSKHVGLRLTRAGADNRNPTTNLEGDYRCHNVIRVRHQGG
ncbi:uncharacterized protein V6R79_017596 [Siganus canaliculatus]